MSEHLPNPEEEREVDRIEIDLSPFLDGFQDRSDGAWDYLLVTRRINAELSKRAIYVALFDGQTPLDAESNRQSMRRVFDEEHINEAILEAAVEQRGISDAAARVIASQLHMGQGSALYALASSGGIQDDALYEIDGAIQDSTLDPLARAWAKELMQYVKSRLERDDVAAVEGWSKLWLEEKPHDHDHLDRPALQEAPLTQEVAAEAVVAGRLDEVDRMIAAVKERTSIWDGKVEARWFYYYLHIRKKQIEELAASEGGDE